MKQVLVNCETGEHILEELTGVQLESAIKDREKFIENKELETQMEIKRAALLERLGITEEEAKLLLG